MKAVVFDTWGGPESLRVEERPEPQAGPGEILLRVRSVAVNRTLDLEVHARGAGWNVPLPHILGADPAGEVVALGEGVSSVQLGARVVTFPMITCGTCRLCRTGRDNVCAHLRLYGVHVDGGYATYAAVPAANLIPIPPFISFEQASAMSLYYPVAWNLLTELGALRSGQTVLIMAAGSGLGVSGIRIARHLGARVIAAAGQDWKLEKALELGAHEAINYADQDLTAQVRRLTEGEGADVVFENIGARALFPQSVQSLATGGRLVTCGSHGGETVELSIREVYRRQLAILGTQAAPRYMADEVFGLVANEKLLPPPIDRTFPLEEAADAHRYILERKNFGRVVLTV